MKRLVLFSRSGTEKTYTVRTAVGDTQAKKASVKNSNFNDFFIDPIIILEPNLLIPGKKPVGNVKLDNQHLVTPDRNYWQMLSSGDMRDIVSGDTYTKYNGSNILGLKGGIYFNQTAGATGSGVARFKVPDIGTMNTGCLFATFEAADDSASQSIFIYWGGVGPIGMLSINIHSSGDVTGRFGSSDSDVIGSYSVGELINAALTWNSGNYFAAVNGKITTGTYTGTVGDIDNNQAANIGSFATGDGTTVNSAFNGYIYQIGLSDTEVPISTLQEWSLDPYSILIPAGLGG